MNSQSALIPSEHGLVECGLRLITSYNLHWRTTMDILATAYTPRAGLIGFSSIFAVVTVAVVFRCNVRPPSSDFCSGRNDR